MGVSILELALRCLEEAGFAANVAYPGQKFPRITEPVAAVRILKSDSASRTVTVEVSILSPAALGGTACELAALRAAEALCLSRAVCVQNGCVYNGAAQIYCVSILATYTAVTEETDCTIGPGFTLYLGDTVCTWAVGFTAEKVQKQRAEFAVTSPEAFAITSGSFYWELQLEELFPRGFSETALPEEEFSLRLIREGREDLFSPCRFTSITRRFTPEGLRRISKVIALTGKEA